MSTPSATTGPAENTAAGDDLLLSFRTANSRSLRHEETLDLQAPKHDIHADGTVPVAVNGVWHGVAMSAGIFGANASGKSNTLRALADMREAVVSSLGHWVGLEELPRSPFALDTTSASAWTLYEVDVLLGGVRWRYGFELSTRRVEREWIYSFPQGRRQVWMDRDASRSEVFQWPGNRVRDRRLLGEITRDNALLLSVAGATGNPDLEPLARWFVGNLTEIRPEAAEAERDVLRRLFEDEAHRERVGALLGVADLGVSGVTIDPRWGSVHLLHRTAGEPVAFPYSAESAGTRRTVVLLSGLVTALERGHAVLVDDLGAGLHPRLVSEIPFLFDSSANSRYAQLVFASHDSTLLGHGEVRDLDPAQVWVADKDAEGVTRLNRLTDARSEGAGGLQSRYLAREFGGTPSFPGGALAEAVRAAQTGGR
ncbi:ATP/GTP-binding protein [Streptomyces sp. NPDC001668]|uniref:AAA family ATPase n=1 Tax=Streptomyces sp. NPDC001668 TaxID=3364598 RepID=UPI00368824CB